MSTSRGVGRLKPPYLQLQPWPNILSTNPDSLILADDWYFGGLAQAPVDIPFSWLKAPAVIRQDPPLNVAEVSITGGVLGRDRDQASIDAHDGREFRFTAELDSIVAADAANLAGWVVDYYDTPRPRCPRLTLILNHRSETEICRVLDVTLGTRITISGAPAGYPQGWTELVVEGVRHRMDAAIRTVVWNTTPVIGAVVGESGPWFTLGESTLGDPATPIPF